MEKKDWEQRIVDYSADLMDKHFPKGECKERGKALVFNAKLITYVMGELDRAREEVLLELLERKTNYKIERVDHGYKVTQEYVLVSDIEKELSKLNNRQPELIQDLKKVRF